MRSTQVSASSRISASHGVALIGAVLLIFGVSAAGYVTGSRMRTQMQDLAAQAITQENAAFCSRFGMGPGMAAHADCVDALGALRARHEQRMQMEGQALP